ncbi:MAG: tetratricopeptide repeat protein [Rhodobacteraceae bacterium]|nr:tetratricopeptide repeat protein [Paracoccaceae bacterium]
MLQDICTCDVSLSDPEAVKAWNGVAHAVLSHGKTAPQHLGRLLELEPGFAMGHAIKGLSALMLARKELIEPARQANVAAQAALAQGAATERERLWCAALDYWLKGAPLRSIACMENALKLNPADTISMKLSHGIRFMVGDNYGMLRSVENVLPAHDPSHPLFGYVQGCHAFALEEMGQYAASERAGLRALAFAGDDAWGLHAVAHVYDMTHQTEAGIQLIDRNQPAWDHCNNFRFHVWWHKALLLLDQGDNDAVLALYDEQVRSEKTDDYRDFSNASSLLMRLELEGVSVGDRWEELAALAETRTDDGCLIFADLHYMLALVGDKRSDAAGTLLARVAQTAEGSTQNARVQADPGVAAAQGLAAFGKAQWGDAYAHLAAAQPSFQSMGGSHAQRDVFERLTIEAGIRAGEFNSAAALIRQRQAQRGGAMDNFASSRLNVIENARCAQARFAAE